MQDGRAISHTRILAAYPQTPPSGRLSTGAELALAAGCGAYDGERMTSPQYVHTCRDIPDLLGLLPTLFGFVPEESIIAIAVDGPRSRLGFRLRMDMPRLDEKDEVCGLVRWHLQRHGADAAILVILTEDQGAAAKIMAGLQTSLKPIPIRLAVTATSERYWRWDHGVPLDEGRWDRDAFSPAVAHAVMAGQQIVANRAELQQRYAAVRGPQREYMQAATRRAVSEVSTICSGGVQHVSDDQNRLAGRQHLIPLLDRALHGDLLLNREQLARISVWIGIAAVRDEVLRGISRTNAEAHAQVWTHAAQYVVPPFEAPVLTLAGLSRWLCGDGTQALMALERAVDADENFLFAQTLMEALRSGLHPRVWDTF